MDSKHIPLSDSTPAGDALDGFPTENPKPARVVLRTSPRHVMMGLGLTIAIVAAIIGVTQLTGSAVRPPRPPVVEPGTLTVNTNPPGAVLTIDGAPRGATPATVHLDPGSHTLVLRSGANERTVPLTIAAGSDVSQYYEFAAATANALHGKLSIATDPPAARVTIDGRPHGTAPVVVADLPAGEHLVTVANDSASAERRITLDPGAAMNVMFSLPKTAGPGAGWVALSAPFDVQVFEGSDLLGTSGSAKIMMAAGRHEIHLSNPSLGYDVTRRVEVAAGKVAAIKVDAPKVGVSVNARPWADVLIDGNEVGQTPLSNISVAIGSHAIVFRHPDLGEQRQTIVVTARGANRVAADMT